jgi:competence protein ComEC
MKKKTTARRIFHSSWLIAWISSGFLLGVLASLKFNNFAGTEWVIVGICCIFIAFRNKSYLGIILAIAAGLSLGLWRGSTGLQAQSGFSQYYETEVIAVGRVSEDPSIETDGKVRLKLKEVIINNQPVGGLLWVNTTDGELIKRSDKLEVEGVLTEGFGTIPAAIFKARLVSIEREAYVDVGRDVRDWFASGIREDIKEPEASLGAGFLLGQKTALPEVLENELLLLGLTHIVVASGYNLTILIRFARRFLMRVSRFTALAGSGALVYFFLQITGFSPSMARASLIAGISLLAWYYGRKLHPLVLLPFAAALTVAINPSYIWGDIGWLLSFGSFIGVIMLSPLIHTYFWGDKKPGNIRQVFIETMSAVVWTLPLVAYVFGQYSPLSIIANVLILPLIPIAMALTALAGITSIILPVGGAVIAWPAELILSYMTFITKRLAQLPMASVEVKVSLTALVLSYLLLITSMLFLWRRTGYEFRKYNVIE